LGKKVLRGGGAFSVGGEAKGKGSGGQSKKGVAVHNKWGDLLLREKGGGATGKGHFEEVVRGRHGFKKWGERNIGTENWQWKKPMGSAFWGGGGKGKGEEGESKREGKIRGNPNRDSNRARLFCKLYWGFGMGGMLFAKKQKRRKKIKAENPRSRRGAKGNGRGECPGIKIRTQ